MAKVILLNGWFANGVLYRKSVTKKGPPVDIPDDVVFDSEGKSRLPSTARIVSDDYETPLVKPGVDTFSEHRAELDANDPDRAAAVAQSEAVEKAEQNLRDQRMANKAKLDRDQAMQQAENKRKFNAELAAEEAAEVKVAPEPEPAPKKSGKKGKTHA